MNKIIGVRADMFSIMRNSFYQNMFMTFVVKLWFMVHSARGSWKAARVEIIAQITPSSGYLTGVMTTEARVAVIVAGVNRIDWEALISQLPPERWVIQRHLLKLAYTMQ